jgi:hypothetical protein
MQNGQMIYAGELVDQATFTIDDRTTCWKICQHQSTSEVKVTFDNRFVVHLGKDNTTYVTVPGNFQKIAVDGGVLHYIVVA